MTELQSNEIRLVGQWRTVGSTVEADNVAKRIDQLVETKLKEVATSEDGWQTLYVDPLDGRYWELSYPQKELHGGGPPALEYMPEKHARRKYNVIESAE